MPVGENHSDACTVESLNQFRAVFDHYIRLNFLDNDLLLAFITNALQSCVI